MRLRDALVISALAVPLAAACDRPPAPTREWTPQDHDRTDENEKLASGAQAARPDRGDAATRSGEEAIRLAELTWQQQCASCHGAAGRGDGPNGPLVKATDLTTAEWQAKATDADIAAAIMNGKGRMPKFDLPPKVVAGLVVRIRAGAGAGGH